MREGRPGPHCKGCCKWDQHSTGSGSGSGSAGARLVAGKDWSTLGGVGVVGAGTV